jgi:hypothetical protein
VLSAGVPLCALPHPLELHAQVLGRNRQRAVQPVDGALHKRHQLTESCGRGTVAWPGVPCVCVAPWPHTVHTVQDGQDPGHQEGGQGQGHSQGHGERERECVPKCVFLKKYTKDVWE